MICPVDLASEVSALQAAGVPWRNSLTFIVYERWQQSGHVFALLPPALGFFADQMKSGSCYGIAPQQTTGVTIASCAVACEALGFWMLLILN
jgi:hypothetical protein